MDYLEEKRKNFDKERTRDRENSIRWQIKELEQEREYNQGNCIHPSSEIKGYSGLGPMAHPVSGVYCDVCKKQLEKREIPFEQLEKLAGYYEPFYDEEEVPMAYEIKVEHPDSFSEDLLKWWIGLGKEKNVRNYASQRINDIEYPLSYKMNLEMAEKVIDRLHNKEKIYIQVNGTYIGALRRMKDE